MIFKLFAKLCPKIWELSDLLPKFYANDTFGRIGFQEVTVVKAISQSNLSGIPGYDILLLLGIASVVSVFIYLLAKIQRQIK